MDGTFRVRADRQMRASAVFRRAGAAIGEGWRRSVYVDRTPRDVTIFFDGLTPPRVAVARAPLAEVGSLSLVVDAVNTKIGTGGQLVIDQVRYQR